jgi:LPPG:FO 2-phospho-L-lactate transferase
MLTSLGHESSALGVARLLADVATDLVIDRVDAALADAVAATGLRVHVLDTIMGGDAGRARFGGELLDLVGVR